MANFAELPVVQTEIRQLNAATPEGVVYAPWGYILTTVAGDVFVKQSEPEVNTGWAQLQFT